ncbi:MAG: nitrogen fixation protein NifQ [Methylobacter sp.]|nr:nitrogen fixation protein NifQ [Methylobacter sp.]MDP2100161.1 nitrogen fixation protein NifQ [Methylobacter sp.]MDP2430265.1 nitrogen fixation protein NifQ [Methylobacter sp.]MDP3055309.1 nitrogen fixation protein NifQ [Methylobacter sp.]MDP3362449.1 nitrogen fixation protein NifQ [Methylobacter sp.]
MSAVLQRQDDREHIHSLLKSQAIISPNYDWLACMVASWTVGHGVLPDYLGLEPAQFNALNRHFFPDYPGLPEHAPSGSKLDFSRMLEKNDLVNLLKQFSHADNQETDWIIEIIVAGCLGNDHLWQDLGLWSRSQLSAMLAYNFPALAAKNVHDMKWKKFLYKQLCEAEGLYLCRVPSCEVCIDYSKCYGSEE